MKKLYIRGSNENSYAVIDILKSIGATNSYLLNGDLTSMFYTYDENGDIINVYEEDADLRDACIYTYSEFYAQFPYKVNDTIVLKSSNKQYNVSRMFWSEQYERIEYMISSELRNELVTVDEIKKTICYGWGYVSRCY